MLKTTEFLQDAADLSWSHVQDIIKNLENSGAGHAIEAAIVETYEMLDEAQDLNWELEKKIEALKSDFGDAQECWQSEKDLLLAQITDLKLENHEMRQQIGAL